jgi:hypothetical protein
MTDDTLPDLRLILRNTENAARDSQAALDAATRAEILLVGVIPRLEAIENRLASIERRQHDVEDSISRSLMLLRRRETWVELHERNRRDNDEPMWVE